MLFERMFPDSPSAKFLLALWGSLGEEGTEKSLFLPGGCCERARDKQRLRSGGMQ